MDEYQTPKKISGFLQRFEQFMPVDRRVRNTLQAYITNILELQETLEKDTVRCTGRVIYLNVHPYLKKEIIGHAAEIITLLREKDHLYFDRIQ